MPEEKKECVYLDKESVFPVCLLRQMEGHERRRYMRRIRTNERKFMKEHCVDCPVVKLDIEHNKIVMNNFL